MDHMQTLMHFKALKPWKIKEETWQVDFSVHFRLAWFENWMEVFYPGTMWTSSPFLSYSFFNITVWLQAERDVDSVNSATGDRFSVSLITQDNGGSSCHLPTVCCCFCQQEQSPVSTRTRALTFTKFLGASAGLSTVYVSVCVRVRERGKVYSPG